MDFDKSKVYTVMTADKVKIGSKGYYADCPKDLEERVNSDDKAYYNTLVEITPTSEVYRFKLGAAFLSEYALFYLVEEPVAKNLRPYKSVDEMLTHFRKYIKPALQGDCMPGVWVIEKSSGFAICVTGFGETDSVIINGDTMSMSILLENYLYLDGTPCGIKED